MENSSQPLRIEAIQESTRRVVFWWIRKKSSLFYHQEEDHALQRQSNIYSEIPAFSRKRRAKQEVKTKPKRRRGLWHRKTIQHRESRRRCLCTSRITTPSVKFWAHRAIRQFYRRLQIRGCRSTVRKMERKSHILTLKFFQMVIMKDRNTSLSHMKLSHKKWRKPNRRSKSQQLWIQLKTRTN